jgi:hypothetical protein
MRAAGASGGNYDLGTEDIPDRLKAWQERYSFEVTDAKRDAPTIRFITLPPGLEALTQEFYEFCPDVIDQGLGYVAEMVEMAQESGQEVSANIQSLIQRVDLDDENYGIELRRRTRQRGDKIVLWWDYPIPIRGQLSKAEVRGFWLLRTPVKGSPQTYTFGDA